jgi:ATP-binding cassette subfamily F protein 3
MPLIALSKVSFDYGRSPILRDVDLALEPGERAAIVGRNGAGKSTLFSVLNGEIRPDRGGVERGRRLRIAHLPQDRALAGELGLAAAVRGECRELVELESRLERALADMEALPSEGEAHDRATRRYGELHHQFESMGGYDLDQRVAATLSGLGFAVADFERPVAELSGGEQRVAALAAVLLQGADLLLLDEPTNHLDLRSIEWLEEHLLAQKAALLMVSHDRSFLNRVCRITFHIKDARLTRYSGNYNFFERERRERERLEHLAYERQQEEIARMEEYIRRNIVGQKTKQAQSWRKRLEKLERLDRPTSERTLRVRLSPARRGGNTVLVAERIAKAFGDKRLFADLDLHITLGEKIGLVGPNGAGKTTLLRVLMGKLPPDAGGVRAGKDIDLGFFDQHLDLVSDAHTVAEEFRTVDEFMSEGELRGQLARFGFFEDDLDKKVGQLSGGERNRLSLLKLVYQRHNFLILDEPTNHLDIPATESLEEALEAYEGTLLLVSHDRSFLERLADRVIEVEGGRVTDYPGSWREFVNHRRAKGDPNGARAKAKASDAAKRKGRPEVPASTKDRDRPETTASAKGKDRPQAPDAAKRPAPGGEVWSKNRLNRKKAELAALERSLAEAIAEKESLEAKLAGGAALDREAIMQLTARHQELTAAIARREDRWARWAEAIEAQERKR